ncbi:TetR-family transcriptional regulator, partial [Streptomyces coelicoflavus ZG0656]
MLEENVLEVEQAAAAEEANLSRVLGVLTWHLTESAAFIAILHADGAGRRPGGPPSYAQALSERVERALRAHLPDGHRLAAADDDLMIAVAMVSGAVTGHTREQREHRSRAAWRLDLRANRRTSAQDVGADRWTSSAGLLEKLLPSFRRPAGRAGFEAAYEVADAAKTNRSAPASNGSSPNRACARSGCRPTTRRSPPSPVLWLSASACPTSTYGRPSGPPCSTPPCARPWSSTPTARSSRV